MFLEGTPVHGRSSLTSSRAGPPLVPWAPVFGISTGALCELEYGYKHSDNTHFSFNGEQNVLENVKAEELPVFT